MRLVIKMHIKILLIKLSGNPKHPKHKKDQKDLKHSE